MHIGIFNPVRREDDGQECFQFPQNISLSWHVSPCMAVQWSEPPPPPAVQEGELSVKVSHPNFRQEPSTKSRVVATLTQGAIIEKLEESGNWIKIKLANGTIGWIYKTLVGPVY